MHFPYRNYNLETTMLHACNNLKFGKQPWYNHGTMSPQPCYKTVPVRNNLVSTRLLINNLITNLQPCHHNLVIRLWYQVQARNNLVSTRLLINNLVITNLIQQSHTTLSYNLQPCNVAYTSTRLLTLQPLICVIVTLVCMYYVLSQSKEFCLHYYIFIAAFIYEPCFGYTL